MNDTPRTDAAEKQIDFAFSNPANRYCDMTSHARELERENAALRAELRAERGYRRALEEHATTLAVHKAREAFYALKGGPSE